MYHTLVIVGNVGGDAEMRYTPEGRAVASFSVACNRYYTNGLGDKVQETTWFRVTAWGESLAGFCNKHVKKGVKILVEGRLNPDPETGGPRIWGDPPRANFEMTAGVVRMLTWASEEERVPVEDEDEIPF